MESGNNLQDTLSFYDVDCHDPFYISSGNPIFKFPSQAFRMDYYALCVCVSGEIHLEIDNHKHTIGVNDFLISAPSAVVHFRGVTDDFVMRLLFFEKNFLLKNISNPFIIEKLSLFQNGFYTIINTNIDNTRSLLNLLDYLKKKSKIKGKFTKEIVRTIIFSLLLEIAEIIVEEKINLPQDKKANANLSLKFIKLVQENIYQHKNVQYYADLLFVSNKYLIQIIKKASGKTPHQIIDEALLKQAFALLGNSNITISEIAFRLQFNSTSAFGRFFKKYASISPSQYRITENILV